MSITKPTHKPTCNFTAKLHVLTDRQLRDTALEAEALTRDGAPFADDTELVAYAEQARAELARRHSNREVA